MNEDRLQAALALIRTLLDRPNEAADLLNVLVQGAGIRLPSEICEKLTG